VEYDPKTLAQCPLASYKRAIFVGAAGESARSAKRIPFMLTGLELLGGK
jgi:hypothetical protein